MFQVFGLPWSGGRPAQPALEMRRRVPERAGSGTPVVFVHGAFVAGWYWDVHFLSHFAERGFTAIAPSLRGHGASEGRERLQQTRLSDYVRDLEHVVGGLDAEPVLVGHSMGGLVVQKYLERRPAAAAVLMATVPPAGLMGSTWRLFMGDPMLLSQLTVMQGFGPAAVNRDIARRAVFSDHVPENELRRYARYTQPESQHAIWDMTAGALPRPWRVRVPHMLVVGAADDALFSVDEMRRTADVYGADLHIERDMAHAMMLEPGWQAVADRIIAWLAERGIR